LKKTYKIAIWSAIIIYLIVTLGFVARKRRKIPCNSVDVIIIDTARNHFITKNEIKLLLREEQKKILGTPIDSIDISHLESIVNQIPCIKKAEIYKTMTGNLVIEVQQRTPIVRVITNNKTSFYIDKDGMAMPLSGTFSARVMVANGDINLKPIKRDSLYLVSFSDSISPNRNVLLNEIYKISRYIYDNPFWKSQIEQIYINEKKEIEMIPKVGSHIIILGSTENYLNKFFKLELLYKEAFANGNWNKYEVINLKFENQVICTKRL
jgi:cell division protein FtsQ